MYGVFTRKTLFALLVILIVVLILMGVAGNVMGVSAAPRELPIYSVETPEKVLSLGINCAWDDSDIDEILKLLDERGVKATFFVVRHLGRPLPGRGQADRGGGARGGQPLQHPPRHDEAGAGGDHAAAGRVGKQARGAHRAEAGPLPRAVWGLQQPCRFDRARPRLGGDPMVERQPRLEGAVGGGDHRAGGGRPPGRGTSCSSTRASPTRPRRSARVIDTLAAQGYRFAPVGSSSTGRPIRSTTRAATQIGI